jgi:hypothetical protein
MNDIVSGKMLIHTRTYFKNFQGNLFQSVTVYVPQTRAITNTKQTIFILRNFPWGNTSVAGRYLLLSPPRHFRKSILYRDVMWGNASGVCIIYSQQRLQQWLHYNIDVLHLHYPRSYLEEIMRWTHTSQPNQESLTHWKRSLLLHKTCRQ